MCLVTLVEYWNGTLLGNLGSCNLRGILVTSRLLSFGLALTFWVGRFVCRSWCWRLISYLFSSSFIRLASSGRSSLFDVWLCLFLLRFSSISSSTLSNWYESSLWLLLLPYFHSNIRFQYQATFPCTSSRSNISRRVPLVDSELPSSWRWYHPESFLSQLRDSEYRRFRPWLTSISSGWFRGHVAPLHIRPPFSYLCGYHP